MRGGRFSDATDEVVSRLNASVGFDQRLFAEDIRGSIAHAEMLGATGVISRDEVLAIVSGLRAIGQEIEAGLFEWQVSLEDLHMNIEAALIERIGDAGKRLHTGRSRNDQIATDMRLWLLGQIDRQRSGLLALQEVLLDLAARDGEAILPGYTHLQRAQAVLLGHHLLAYVEMFERDIARLVDCRKRAAESPLGAAALAGTPYPIDRRRTAEALGFDRPMANSLDAVADRDFAVEFVSAAALAMIHLSRLAEELVLWSSQEFGFVELGDAFATGSSIMPQKKNPDIPELCRAKAGRVIGDLVTLLTVLKGLPLAYNKDLQEDKEALFDAADTLDECVLAMSRLLPACRFDTRRMRAACEHGFVTATDVADYLVGRGAPFREAHAVVGRLVAWCIAEDRTLASLDLATFRSHSPLFEADVCLAVSVEASVARRTSQGGTAPPRVAEALAVARSRLQLRRCEA